MREGEAERPDPTDGVAAETGAAGASVDALPRGEAAELFESVFDRHERVVLAVSGGGDSLALLLLAAEWARLRGRPQLFVATVDHGLRREAEDEIATVARLAGKLGLPHTRLEARLTDVTGVEEKARTLRLAALAAHARLVNATAFATAHTLEDQAETVLMRFAAGSGPSGLAAMATEVKRGPVAHLRPLLGVPKARLTASLAARGVGWADDAMNGDPRFARARLRAARTALEREGLTVERLARFAHRMARINATLDAATKAAAKAHLSEKDGRWTIAPGAAALPDEIKLRLLGQAVAAAGTGKIKLERLERLADRIVTDPEGAATLGGARVSWSRNGRITLTREGPRGGRGAGGEPGL